MNKEIEKSIIKKYRKEIWAKFIKAINDYQLVEENDKIAAYNDSISWINRSNPGKEAIKLKEYKDAPALFYKEMREAGILGIIQSTPLPTVPLMFCLL